MKKIILIGFIILLINSVTGTEYYINNSGGDKNLTDGIFNNAIWDRACQYDRLNIYQTSGLVSYWSMDCYDYDNIVEDVSNVSLNDGINYGSTFNQTGGINGTGGFSFDGVDDYIDFEKDVSLNLRYVVTWSIWIKRNEINESQTIMTKNNQGWVKRLTFNLNDTLGWIIKFDGLEDTYNSNTSIDDFNWHYISGTYNQTHVIFYVDGVEAGKHYVGNYTLKSASGDELYLGSNSYAEEFNGSIDELIIYNISLSQTQIYNNYNSWNKNKSTQFKNIGNVTYNNIIIEGNLRNITLNKIINRTVKIYLDGVLKCNLEDSDNFCEIFEYYENVSATFELYHNNNTPAFDQIIFKTLFGCCCCYNCSDCTEKANKDFCIVLNLRSNIYNETQDNCVFINNLSNKKLECNNHIITGVNGLQNGVYLNNSINVSVVNCDISNFQNGIKIEGSNINEIKNNTVCNNWEWDIIGWDAQYYGVNNTATNIYNFEDIGYNDLTTYQCILIDVCIRDITLIAVYIILMFIFIFGGLLIDKQLFYLLFGFCLFMMIFSICNICYFDFLAWVCLIVAIYFLYKTIITKNY